MQDENVACHDIGKLSFERAVGCFGTPPTRARDSFPNAPTRARDLFRNAPTRARDSFSQCSKSSCDSLSNVPIRTRMIASSKSVHSAGFFYI